MGVINTYGPPDTTSVQLDVANNLVEKRFYDTTDWADRAMDAALAYLDQLKSVSTEMPAASSYALMELTKGKLQYYIENAWDGLGADVEDALFKRMWERDDYAAQKAKEKLADDWSESGFSLPDGTLSMLWSEIDKQALDKRMDQSREVTAMMAEYAFKFKQFVIEQAINLYIKEEQVRLEVYTSLLRLREAIAEGGARVATQLAASALSGINVSASLSASAGVSETNNKSQSYSESTQISSSFIEEHIIQE